MQYYFFFFQAEDGIRDHCVTGVQTCALPIYSKSPTSAGSTTVNLHINSKDVDKLWNQALNAGAKPTLPLENQFWGERYGKLQDPFGHIWSVSMPVQMSEREKEAKRQAAFAMMGAGEEPASEKSWP